jgi:pimeloyl-[acyl-carrier protein] synthase
MILRLVVTAPGRTRAARSGLPRRWAVTSGAIAFIMSSGVRSRPHAPYRALRALDPVHHSPLGFWLLSGHDEVSALLRNPSLSNDERQVDLSLLHLGPFGGQEASRPGPFVDLTPNLLLFLDPPDHTRVRALVARAFTPRAVAAFEERLGVLIEHQLDQLVRRGEMDLLADFAYPVPALAICELLGAPTSDAGFIATHAPILAARLDPSPFRDDAVRLAGDASTLVMTEYLNRLIEQRRRDPGPDLLSTLIAAGDDEDRLSHDELVANIILLLMAGHETTANLLGNGVHALMHHPEQLDLLRRNPELGQSAVEELLRFDGPIQLTERIPRQDIEVAGQAVKKGSVVILCIAAANRDPLVFPDPHQLDITRSPNPHLAFGGGSHFCVGAPLARLEARLALRALFDRLPNLRLANGRGNGHRQQWRKTLTIRGLQRLDVRWNSPPSLR